MRLHSLAASACLLALCAASSAAAKGNWQTVETWGWRAEIPKDWKLVSKRKANPKRPFLGLWVYASKNKSFQLRVRTSDQRGRAFAAVAKKGFQRVVRRLPSLKILRSKVVPLAGRKLWYFFGSARMLRKTKNHEYLVFRLLLHAPYRKLFVGVELEAVDEKLRDIEGFADRIMESFALVDPKTVKLPAPQKSAPRSKGGVK